MLSPSIHGSNPPPPHDQAPPSLAKARLAGSGRSRTLIALSLAASLVAVAAASRVASADPLSGKGSIGAGLGSIRFTGGKDFSDGAQIRPVLRMMAHYAWQDHFVSVLEGGYGWNAYDEGGDFRGPDTTGTIAIVTPITLGLDYRFASASPKLIPHFGLGVGAYPLTIRAGRDRISLDRLNYKRRRKVAGGGYAKIGAEFLALPAMLLNADLLYHFIPMSDEKGFPGGYFDASASLLEFRVGISYYFTIKPTGPSPEGAPEGEEKE